MQKSDVTVTITTRGRTLTTLPLCLMSIVNQTKLPKTIIVYDDNKPEERIDFRSVPHLNHILRLFSLKGINWRVDFTRGVGQTRNHQTALYDAPDKYIFRIDDDEVAESNTIEVLEKAMEYTSAAGPCVVRPDIPIAPLNLMADHIEYLINKEYNIPHPQFCIYDNNKIEKSRTDNLHSCFMFHKDRGQQVGYNIKLKVGQSEETQFSYLLFKKYGYLYVEHSAIVWHLRIEGGRLQSDVYPQDDWIHDQVLFEEFCASHNVSPAKIKIFVLNNGLGDHLVFRSLWDQIEHKYEDYKIYIACCYPEVFNGIINVPLLSIAEAYNLGISDDKVNIYAWMDKNKWNGHIRDAMVKFYEL